MNGLLLHSCIESLLGAMHCVIGWGFGPKQSRQIVLTSQSLCPSGRTRSDDIGKLHSMLACDQCVEKDKAGGDRE